MKIAFEKETLRCLTPGFRNEGAMGKRQLRKEELRGVAAGLTTAGPLVPDTGPMTTTDSVTVPHTFQASVPTSF